MAIAGLFSQGEWATEATMTVADAGHNVRPTVTQIVYAFKGLPCRDIVAANAVEAAILPTGKRASTEAGSSVERRSINVAKPHHR